MRPLLMFNPVPSTLCTSALYSVSRHELCCSRHAICLSFTEGLVVEVAPCHEYLGPPVIFFAAGGDAVVGDRQKQHGVMRAKKTIAGRLGGRQFFLEKVFSRAEHSPANARNPSKLVPAGGQRIRPIVFAQKHATSSCG